MAYTFLVLAVIMIIAQVDGQDYCKICSDHTMCLYGGTSSACNQVIRTGVTDTEKAAILSEHNKYRQTVARGQETRGNPGPQPSAANMKVLIWDNEIAKIAQTWAQQCLFEHDKCRKDINGAYVGQNLYVSSSSSSASTVNWQTAVKAWYDEVPQFSRSNVSPFTFTSGTGHYSQAVWATTTKVGCGYINYFDGKWYKHLCACNYSPGGNIIGTEMYKIGTACSACSGTCNSQYNGLCN